MNIAYTTRQGHTVHKTYTRQEALARLTYLDEQETLTKRVAPTDSGDVRFNYLNEAHAIRTLLNQ